MYFLRERAAFSRNGVQETRKSTCLDSRAVLQLSPEHVGTRPSRSLAVHFQMTPHAYLEGLRIKLAVLARERDEQQYRNTRLFLIEQSLYPSLSILFGPTTLKVDPQPFHEGWAHFVSRALRSVFVGLS